MSKLTEVWGGSKAQIADKVRIYSDKTGKVPAYIMLHLLHEAINEITELEHRQESSINAETLELFHVWMAMRMGDKGINQTELSRLSGVSNGTVSRLLNGKAPKAGLATITKIVEVLQ